MVIKIVLEGKAGILHIRLKNMCIMKKEGGILLVLFYFLLFLSACSANIPSAPEGYLINVAESPVYVGDTVSLRVYKNEGNGHEAFLTNVSGEVNWIASSESAYIVGDDLTATHVDEKFELTAIITDDGNIYCLKTELPIHPLQAKKSKSSLYTEEKITIARENAHTYSWAYEEAQRSIHLADFYLGAFTYDDFWKLITPSDLPRFYYVNQEEGCLNCGDKIAPWGMYPYRLDCINSPFKVECPNCHMQFPTNNFENFYYGGLDEQGNFNYALAMKYDDERVSSGQPSNLVNVSYPERGMTWGIDDGYGYVSPDGSVYTFIAYFNHWGLWFNTQRIESLQEDTGLIMDMTRSLSQAYIFTGEQKYADGAAVLFARIAQVYPQMLFSEQRVRGSETEGIPGKIVDRVWSADMMSDFIEDYDAVYTALDSLGNEAREFLTHKNQNIDLGCPERLKCYIEDHIVCSVIEDIQRGLIFGNQGMHQKTLLLAAVVLNHSPETERWTDFLYTGSGTYADCRDGCGLDVIFADQVNSDGVGSEGAVLYNSHWSNRFLDICQLMLEANENNININSRILNDKKLWKLLKSPMIWWMNNQQSPSIGDSGYTGKGVTYLSLKDMIQLFKYCKDEDIARFIYKTNNKSYDNLHYDIFTRNPESIQGDLQAIIERSGFQLQKESENYKDTGFCVLRSNGTPNTEAWIDYGQNGGHGHAAALNVGFYLANFDLMPDLGYPDSTDTSDLFPRMAWISNTIAHNTVTVDKMKQEVLVGPADCKLYQCLDKVHAIQVAAPQVYPQTEAYERTLLQISVNDGTAYYVDFFHIVGGSEHVYSFHGAEGIVQVKGLELVDQKDSLGNWVGSYAGSDQPYGEPTADEINGELGWHYKGGGYQWLKNVSRDISPGLMFSVDYQIKDSWDSLGKGKSTLTENHLRITMLGEWNEIALADGIPPQKRGGNPASLKYVLAKRTGNTLESIFTSVIDAWVDHPKITFIESVQITDEAGRQQKPSEAVAMKVTTIDGNTDYIAYSPQRKLFYIDNQLEFGGGIVVYRVSQDKKVSLFTLPDCAQGSR